MRVVESPSRELFKKKADIIYTEAMEEYLATPIKGPYELLLSMLKGVDKFFGTLRKPLTSRELLLSYGDVPTKTYAKKFYTGIVNDLKIAFAEQDAIADNIVATVNYGQALKGAVSEELGRLRSTTDAAMASSITTASTSIIFEDDFSTTAYVNMNTAPTAGTVANVDTVAGALTLHKETSEKTIKNGSEVSIFSYEIAPVKPSGGTIKELIPAIYAGASHGLTGAGSAIPTTQGALDDMVRPNIKTIVGQGGIWSSKNPVFLDALKMVDDSPSSIWEAELIVLEKEKNTPIVEFGDSRFGDDMYFSSGYDRAIDFIDYRPKRLQLTKEFLSSSLPFNPDNSAIRYIWNSSYTDPKTAGLQMSLKIKLAAPARVGQIEIKPHKFAKNCPPRVTSIRVVDASSGDSSEVDLTSSVGITDDSGFLNENVAYIIGNMNVSAISIDFEQKQSYPIKYELGVFKGLVRRKLTNMGQTLLPPKQAIFFVDVQGKKLMGALEEKLGAAINPALIGHTPGTPIEEAIWADTRTHQLVQALAPDVMKNVCKSTSGAIVKKYENHRTLLDNREEYLSDFVGTPSVIVVPSSMSNKKRFAIGIEDIVLSTVIFSEESEIDTKTWQSSYPIGAVSLSTTELVPTEFLTATKLPWITYFLSFDNGRNFYQIAPIGNTPIYKDGYQIPTLIRVNSDVPKERYSIYPWGPKGFVTTDSSPKTVILKIRLRRPADSDGGQFSGFTPRLDKYRLTIEPVAVGGSL